MPYEFEIGTYLEEQYIFSEYLAYFNLFEMIPDHAEFLMNEANWSQDKLKKKFGENVLKELPPNVRKMKKGKSGAKHSAYYAMHNLFSNMEKEES